MGRSRRGGKGLVDEEWLQELAETRQRSRAIDRYVDLIPASLYIGSFGHGKIRPSLDPAKLKRTSFLVSQSAVAQNSGDDGSGDIGSRPISKADKRKQQRFGVRPSAKAPMVSTASSRDELHAKLERRIAELKEERRRIQSARDKAKAAAVRVARQMALSRHAQETSTGPAPVGDSPEVGRLSFDVKEASVPFEAGVGRKGDKMRRMQTDLRKAERDVSKLSLAEAEGRGEKVRLDLAMHKALKRARGEKVHDDVSKLRKAQRVAEAKKRKSRETWDATNEALRQQSREKADKRNDNILKRSAKNKFRSGFEGARGHGFINDDR